MPALTDTKPSEVLRGSKALTHGESQAAGDTELLAAAQLIMPSHPLKAIVLWNRNQYPTHCYELSLGAGTLDHWESKERERWGQGNTQGASTALPNPEIWSEKGEPGTQNLQVPAAGSLVCGPSTQRQVLLMGPCHHPVWPG